MGNSPSPEDAFLRLTSQPFLVTPYQVAAALHHVCPLRGCGASARPWEQCRRSVSLIESARSLLERASTEQVVPSLRAEAHLRPDHEQGQALPPGYEQTRLLDL